MSTAKRRLSKVGRTASHNGESKETGRIEAFSDGVFAIAITLLILNIKVFAPEDLHGHRLLTMLLQQWPSYLAYFTSFLTILIMWINHHKMFQTIVRTDHTFLILNGLLLMWVTVVPYPTALMAEFIRDPNLGSARTATAVFSGCYVLIAIFFNLMWRYAAGRDRLLSKDRDAHFVRGLTAQYRFGPLLYIITFALAFVSVKASVDLCLLLAVYFALPTPKRKARAA